MSDSLADRIKGYERRKTDRAFLPMLPVYARIDGRSFSRFTDGMERPFDAGFSDAMARTAAALVEHSQARIAYTQSDEINLLWLAEQPKSEIFFRGKIQKMVSLLAAFATAAFTRFVGRSAGTVRLPASALRRTPVPAPEPKRGRQRDPLA